MSITITKINRDKYKVTIHKGVVSTHIVAISDEIHSQFTENKISKEQFLKKTFLFLLQREANTEILEEFNIEIITKYFPEFSKIGKIGWIDVSG